MSDRKIIHALSGILILSGCHVIYLGIVWVLIALADGIGLIEAIWPNDSYISLGLLIWATLAMGLIQFACALPLYRYFKEQAKAGVSFGIATAAGFTLFITGGYFIIVGIPILLSN
ncbi:MAG: hypothetical protein AAFP09_00415 [Cyanobacteria bacterium J06607_10]